jgi:hypothetical protein
MYGVTDGTVMIAVQITSAEKQSDLPHYLNIYCAFMSPSLRMKV